MDDKVADKLTARANGHLAGRIENIHESSTLQMARLCRELMAKGFDIISLSLGEPDFDTPEHIRKAAIEAINKGYTHYPPVAGYDDLRKAIADKFKRENDLDYNYKQIIVSTGAKQSIINVILSLCEKGDEVLVPAPYWVSYPEMIKVAEARPVFIYAGVESEYKITPEQLEAAITPKTRAFIYSSPSNPTGSVYSYEELQALAEVFARHPEVFIISDEIYEHINYKGRHVSLAQFPEIHERVIVINGVSKSFAMTGWRIGYMAAAEWITRACEKLQGQFTSAACSISQRATLAALTSDMGPTYEMRDQFKKRRDLVLAKLAAIPDIKCNTPEGAFYLFPDVSAYFGRQYEDKLIETSDDLCSFLVEKANVTIVSGSGFGNENCIRISYAASESQLNKALDRVKSALELLK